MLPRRAAIGFYFRMRICLHHPLLAPKIEEPSRQAAGPVEKTPKNEQTSQQKPIDRVAMGTWAPGCAEELAEKVAG